ncbi:hypothetical protein B0H19DRAFT_1255281 [Mycena capillaripes]|nr:hypothetical protein B0H19DRAFT_1255281 [Mycena capillaripes]
MYAERTGARLLWRTAAVLRAFQGHAETGRSSKLGRGFDDAGHTESEWQAEVVEVLFPPTQGKKPAAQPLVPVVTSLTVVALPSYSRIARGSRHSAPSSMMTVGARIQGERNVEKTRHEEKIMGPGSWCPRLAQGRTSSSLSRRRAVFLRRCEWWATRRNRCVTAMHAQPPPLHRSHVLVVSQSRCSYIAAPQMVPVLIPF